MKIKTSIVTLFLFLALSIGVAANDDVYFWDFIDSAKFDCHVNEGLFEYTIIPYESIDDGIEHYFEASYGLSDHTQTSAYFSYYGNDFTLSGGVKHKISEQNQLTTSFLCDGTFSHDSDSNLYSISPKLLFTKESDRMELYGNISFTPYIFDFSGDYDPYISNRLIIEKGLTLELFPKHTIRAELTTTVFKFKFNELQVDMKAGYQAKLSDQLTYNTYISTELLELNEPENTEDNLHITNAITLKPTKDLALSGAFKFNSINSNGISVNVEKLISDSIKIKSSFWMWFKDSQGLKLGIQYKL